MSDAALGQLARQTDARARTSCLYYDSLGRMRGRVRRTDENCAATASDGDLDSSYVYDAQGRVQRVANDNVSRSFTYDSCSRVRGVSVTVDSLTRTSGHSYDDLPRPTAVTYPGGEVITTTYGSPGVPVGLSNSVHGALVDSVNYDEAGCMTALRFPAGGNLWRTQSYYPWTEPKNGGMLSSLKVGLSEGGGERLSRGYAYNSFGDITTLTEGATSNSFTYDGLGRLTSAYGRSYSYDGASRLTAFNGQAYGYGDSGPFHAVDRIGGADRFDYDANGNMVKRNKGLSGQQTLAWDAENRLSQVQDNNGDLIEQYWYDVDGARVKKVTGSTTTYTFFAQYEEEVTGVVTTSLSYYSFGGLRIAVKRGSDLFHLHGDRLGSTSLTTDSTGATTASRTYNAYGSERVSIGDLQTNRTYAGQKRDSTGLMYCNARDYDPALGTFISPDTIVPGTGQAINYNRFLYASGNPLKFSDPSGFIPEEPAGPSAGYTRWEVENYWMVRYYRAHGYAKTGGSHWTTPITAEFSDKKILTEVLDKAGIAIDSQWGSLDPEYELLVLLAQGAIELAQSIGEIVNRGTFTGLKALKSKTSRGVIWALYESINKGGCASERFHWACVHKGNEVHFKLGSYALKNYGEDFVRATAVHEMAHVIHFTCSDSRKTNIDMTAQANWESVESKGSYAIVFSRWWPVENFISTGGQQL